MATAMMPRVGDEIKLGPEPQIFALRFVTGKSVASRFPGGRVMFTAVDDRKIFLNDEDANDFEHAMLDLGVQPADFIRVSRVTHGRGGGFSIRVQLAEETRLESDLKKSIDLARRRPPTTEGRTEAATPRREPASDRNHSTRTEQLSSPAAGTDGLPNSSPLTGKLCSSMCLLIDVMVEARMYATRKGLDLSSEDLRALVVTSYISESKGGCR